MTISPPLIADHEPFNALANRFARELSTSFGYSLSEAEEHIRNYYFEYEASIPEMNRRLKEVHGIEPTEWSAELHFWHEGSAIVLLVGYRLAGGDPGSLKFLDWRKNCWDALNSGQRVPPPML
ncbi:MAG: hypothetical protein QM773_05170 [Hyphomonadaceae bacterium]